MTVHLVTGHKGSAHISSSDVGEQNALTIGSGIYLMSGCECSLTGASKVGVTPGSIMAEGRFVRLTDVNTELIIESGTAGNKRNDIIAAHYNRNSSDVETVTLVVVKGTPTTGTPTDPAMPSGSARAGDANAYWPLFRVQLDGVTLSAPTRIIQTYEDYMRKFYLNTVYPVGAVYISYVSTNPATLFGGNWTQITGRFLRMANDVNTGGSDSVTLGVANMPSHSHTVNNHTHQFTRVSGMYGTRLSSAQCALPKHTHTALPNAFAADIAAGTSYTTNVVNTTSRKSDMYTTSSKETTYAEQEHTHGLTSASFNTGGATPGTSAVGSGTAFSNMPAYQDLYAWRRTS